MLEDAQKAVKLAQKHGCTYCDARAEVIERQALVIEDGQLENLVTKHEKGVGIRVLCDGAWGFYSTSDLTKLEEGITCAIRSAKHYAAYKKEKIKLAEIPVSQKKINYKAKKQVDVDDLVKIAFDCDKIIRSVDKISKSTVAASNVTTTKHFVSSDGAKIQQDFADLVVDLVATARSSGITQSINTTEGGRGGLEKITDETDIYLVAKEIAKKTSELVEAKTAKEEKATVVMNPDFVALLTHEILGHPSEADRVLGKEMAWAGGAWWAGMLIQQ
jgi:TldD protein